MYVLEGPVGKIELRLLVVQKLSQKQHPRDVGHGHTLQIRPVCTNMLQYLIQAFPDAEFMNVQFL